jgi:hypothetical protein
MNIVNKDTFEEALDNCGFECQSYIQKLGMEDCIHFMLFFKREYGFNTTSQEVANWWEWYSNTVDASWISFNSLDEDDESFIKSLIEKKSYAFYKKIAESFIRKNVKEEDLKGMV